jgi:Mg2+ and Co2+ transporter CorA
MNKKLNTIFFILGATLFNVLVAVISFVLLTLVYIKFIMNLIPEQSRSWGFTLIFLLAIVVSFLVYRYLLKYLLTKVNVEKYFDPIFVRRNIKKTGS